MTLDTVAKVSAAYILTILVSASGYTLWEDFSPRTGAPEAPYIIADR